MFSTLDKSDKDALRLAFNDCTHAIDRLRNEDYKLAMFCMVSCQDYIRQVLFAHGISEEDCKGELSRYLDKLIKENVR